MAFVSLVISSSWLVHPKLAFSFNTRHECDRLNSYWAPRNKMQPDYNGPFEKNGRRHLEIYIKRVSFNG